MKTKGAKDYGLTVKTYEILVRSCLKCERDKSYGCSYRKMNNFCPDVLAAARFYDTLREEAEKA